MTSSDTAQIKKFINDTALQEVIKRSLIASFMRRKEKEVNYLAAQMLAIQFLEEAWRELSANKEPEQKELKPRQIGL